MDEFLELLDQHSAIVEEMLVPLEKETEGLDLAPLRAYLVQLEQMVSAIFALQDQQEIDLSQEFVIQVLNDILSGVEQGDRVLLTDTLRYGLLELYFYIGAELRGEVADE